MKIHIIGASGSGKSYLAEILRKKYNIPHFDLDDIFWDNKAKSYGVKMPLDKRDKKLGEILSKENWIIEGAYYSWLAKSFQDANKIVVLYIPNFLCSLRIIRRFFKRKLGLCRGKKETLKSLVSLLNWNSKYKEENFPKIFEMIDKYKAKTVVIHNKKELRNFINAL